jgi:exopolysaccharide biosynthesis polyprenyl glycosylphosphotransferase
MSNVSSPAVETETLKQSSAAGVPATLRAAEAWPGGASRKWRYAFLRRMLACADLAAGLLASLSLLILAGGDAGHLAWSLVYLPAWILVAKLLGLYDRDESALRHLTVDEVPQLVVWAVVGASGLSLFLELTPAGRPDASSAVTAGIVAAVSVLPLRALVRWTWRTVTPPERVVVVGPAANTDAFRRKLELFPDLHMTIVDERVAIDVEDEKARALLAASDRLVLAPVSLDDEQVRELLEISRAMGLLLTVVPPGRGIFGPPVHLNRLAELTVLQYTKGDLSRSTLLLKRFLDVVVSAVALVVLLPVFALIAVAIKLDGRGPVIFTQWRAGRNGRPFQMRKFRTMIQNAEELLTLLVRLDDPEPVFKLERDPRVTRVGRRLRRWSLDELPQLVNILRGEMSLVGPRPEQVELVDRYSSEQRVRLTIKPGLTGPMQVYGRGALGMEERFAVERDYIENLSLGHDIRILAMTVSVVFRGKGAF